jgi:hypothetical protein
MKRAATFLAAAAALALSAVFSAGTASASTSAVTSAATEPTTVDTPEDDHNWDRYRDYPNYLLCESTGATGVVLGRWDDWWCDDDDVLWVKR